MGLEGDTAVIGSPGDNAVLVFQNHPTEDGWTPVARLTPKSTMWSRFGKAVAINQGRIAVSGVENGVASVQLFTLTNKQWARSETVQTNCLSLDFADSIAMSGDRLLMSIQGGACVYRETSTGWQLETTLSLPVTTTKVYEVALDGDRAVLATTGAAYVFEQTNGVWTSPTAVTGTISNFGETVAIGNNRLVVGSRVGGHIFEKADGVWTQQAEIRLGSLFGDAAGVSISGDRVGVAVIDPNFGISASVYQYDGSKWVVTAGGSGPQLYGGKWFVKIARIAVSDQNFIMGCPDANYAPSAPFVFAKRGTEIVSLTTRGASPNKQAVSASGSTVIVRERIVQRFLGGGSFLVAEATGRVAVYRKEASGLTLERMIESYSVKQAGSNYTSSNIPPVGEQWATVSGDRLAMVANNVVFIHERTDGSWPRVATFGLRDLSFGEPRIEMSGDTLVVAGGASNAPQTGQARVYHRDLNGKWAVESTFGLDLGNTPLTSLAITGDWMFFNASEGIRIFHRSSAGTWATAGHLAPPNKTLTGFGSIICADGNQLLIGASTQVCLYGLRGSKWVLETQLTPSAPITGLSNASVSGDLIALASAGSLSQPSPSVIIFRRLASGTWLEGSPAIGSPFFSQAQVQGIAIAGGMIVAKGEPAASRGWVAVLQPTPVLDVYEGDIAPNRLLSKNQSVELGGFLSGQKMTRTFSVRNIGGAPFVGLRVRSLPEGNTPLSIVQPKLKILGVAQSTSFSVTVAPEVVGQFSITLSIESDSTSAPRVDIVLQGEVTSTAEPPTIIEAPLPLKIPLWLADREQTFASSDAISLNVKAHGTGPFTYQWTRNGKVLPGETLDRLNVINSDLTLAHGGDYRVIVKSPRGQVVSDPVPVVVAINQRLWSLNEGSSTTIGAPVGGPSRMRYQWTRANGTTLADNVRVKEINTTRLHISHAEETDSDSYSLSVIADDGSETVVHTAAISVIPKPYLTNSTLGPWATCVPVYEELATYGQATSITVSGLPPGVHLASQPNSIEGTTFFWLEGVPAAAGTFQVSLQCKGIAGTTKRITLPVTVSATPFPGQGSFAGLVLQSPLGDTLPSEALSRYAKTIDLTFAANGVGTGKLLADGKQTTIRAQAVLGGSDFTVRVEGSPIFAGTEFMLSANGDMLGDMGGSLFALKRLADPILLARALGRFTALLDAGRGYSAMEVTSRGSLLSSGKLADGSAFSASSPLCRDLLSPICLRSFTGRSAIQGWASISLDSVDPAKDTVSSQWTWISETSDTAVEEVSSTLTGERYQPPAKGSAMWNLDLNATPNAHLDFTFASIEGPDVTTPLDHDLTITASHTGLMSADPTKSSMTFKLNPTTGIFSGRFTFNDDSRWGKAGQTREYSGAVLSQSRRGEGLFPFQTPLISLELLFPPPAARPSRPLQFGSIELTPLP